MIRENIQTAIANYAKAKVDLQFVLKMEQAVCTHAGTIIHLPWKGDGFFVAQKARRLCLQCGLEELAKNSGWGDDDSDFDKLKTNGFHKVISDTWEFCEHRLPEAAVPNDWTWRK